jgi:hypothetical protein
MTATIQLIPSGFAIVDEADVSLVASFKWYRVKRGSVHYAARYTEQRSIIYMHRVILTGAELVDHANQDGLDNRRNNLRAADKSLNQANSGLRSSNRSGFKGVHFNKAKKRWQVNICVKGVKRTLGRFATAEEAAKVYDHAAIEAFGEFAWTNFPQAHSEQQGAA